ncbi:MAG: endolytic transglycosylase MltG [Clostridia bacterium]|nr:endolytic transglycosylase MltG [Clostridia bacterium]
MADSENNNTFTDSEDFSLDELIRSTKEEIAKVDEMMGSENDLYGEDEAETALNENVSGMPTFEPVLPNEYADLTLDDEEKAQVPDDSGKIRIPSGVKALVYVCCLLAGSILLAVFGWKCAEDVLALSKPDKSVMITVPENASVEDVTTLMTQNGLVDYDWLFRLYCLFSHAERKIVPGTYELNSIYDYHALVNAMAGSSGERATTSITIPEGYECKDVFALLEEHGVCSVENLEKAAATYEFDYDFLRSIPYGEKNRLEGYLFPDTYEFYLNDKAESVLNKFLRNFNSKVTDEMRDAVVKLNERIHNSMREGGFSETEIANTTIGLHEVITVASLVEKETARTSESAMIASVIYNRLCSKLYPCLEIDATIQYILDERKENLTNVDKAIISPYNTYTNAGLPAGPIANPGINSIRAAIYPAESKYYFYALSNAGVHYFSETYYEHLDFLEKLEKENGTD